MEMMKHLLPKFLALSLRNGSKPDLPIFPLLPTYLSESSSKVSDMSCLHFQIPITQSIYNEECCEGRPCKLKKVLKYLLEYDDESEISEAENPSLSSSKSLLKKVLEAYNESDAYRIMFVILKSASPHKKNTIELFKSLGYPKEKTIVILEELEREFIISFDENNFISTKYKMDDFFDIAPEMHREFSDDDYLVHMITYIDKI